MDDHHNKKKFLKLPKYPGGTEAFRKFIADNIRYPDAAIEARIEGGVIVEYAVSDDGGVSDLRVLKSLGYGCDEEAMRVVSLLRFEKVKNRGLRVKMTNKATINFKLTGGMTINYSVSNQTKPRQKPDGPVTYDYTITF